MQMSVFEVVSKSIYKILKNEKKIITTLLYYSFLEALLVLSIPLASSFVINSVIAHADISVVVLGFIVFMLFLFITALKMTREYIIEKFQQKIFVIYAIEIAQKIFEQCSECMREKEYKKYMNYFFDITAVQKFFPLLLLDGIALAIKVVVSLILLFIFDNLLFEVGMLFFIAYIITLFILGRKGLLRAVARSDTKHEAIFFLQNIDCFEVQKEQALRELDEHLLKHTQARESMFSTIISQQGLTFFTEGLVMSSFLLFGSYLVIKGSIPLGEFIASEIIILTIIYALKSFVKKLDFFYEAIEGIYKISKLKYRLEQGCTHDRV